MFSNGVVQSFKVFPQSSNCCLHCYNTMFPLRPPTNFKYRFFFSESMFISSFMPLMVDHVTRVAVAGGCDHPITCTSLGKSTNTTFSASTSNTFSVSSSRSVGVEVPNVLVIATSLEAPKRKRKPKCDIQQFFKDN